jgi:RNA polymerase sigma-70 factor (ECF subfamily)
MVSRAPAPSTPDDPSDDDLMRRLATGDAEASRLLVGRHLGRVHGFAARVLGDAMEAEDVTQEVFLRLWQQAPGWRPGGARLSTWLYRVTLNRCLDRRARRREQPLDDVPDPVDPHPGPAEAFRRRETASRVQAELMNLTAAQRAAIALCHYDGLRNIDAADVLGISVEALESLLARARRTLRERLRELAPEVRR